MRQLDAGTRSTVCAQPRRTGTVVLIATLLLLLPTSCKRKPHTRPNQAPPALDPPTARPLAAARRAPPVKRRVAPVKPASVNPRRPAPLPGPKKLLAFLADLEATGGKAFKPVPLLKKHLGNLDQHSWAGSLTRRVTVKVLRVGSKPLVGALVLFTPDGFKLCASSENPVAVSAMEFAPRKGEPYLVLGDLKTQIRAGLKPKVKLPPHFATTRAFFVSYEYDDNLEGCQPEDVKRGRPADSKVALFKAGRRRLVPVESYTTSGSDGAWGQYKETNGSLTWYASKRAGLHYLGVVVTRTNRCVETAGDSQDAPERISYHTSVMVIAMERGKYWKYYRGKKLKQLRTQEPSLKKLPKTESGGNSTTCNP